MSKEQDTGGEKNIDAIRQLLQKLEDAARRDVEQRQLAAPPAPPAPVPESSLLKPVGAPIETRNLASLQRAPALTVVPPEPAGSPIARRDQFDVPPVPEPTRSRPFIVLPVLAFMLGVASAIAAVLSFEDLRRLVMQGPGSVVAVRTSEEPLPSASSSADPAPPTEAPRAPEPTRVEVASEPVAAPLPVDERLAVAPAAPDSGSLAVASPVPAVRISMPDRFALASGERAPFPLRFEPAVREADGLLLVFRGVPESLVFSRGSSIGGEIWMLPAHVSDELSVSVAEASLKAIRLSAELVALDGRVVARAETSIEVSNTVAAETAEGALRLDEKAMIRLGELLLDTGDVAGARAVLERAAAGGSGQAAFRLAETYDPARLSGVGLQPAAGDTAAARRWYEKASSLGNTQAPERIQGLAQ